MSKALHPSFEELEAHFSLRVFSVIRSGLKKRSSERGTRTLGAQRYVIDVRCDAYIVAVDRVVLCFVSYGCKG